MRFEPICNCPGVASQWGSYGIGGQEEKFLSEAWVGAISGGMLDNLIFIEEGDSNSDAVMCVLPSLTSTTTRPSLLVSISIVTIVIQSSSK